MSDLKAKMHQNRFRLGLHLDPAGGAYNAPQALTSKGRGEKGREEKGRRGQRRRGKGAPSCVGMGPRVVNLTLDKKLIRRQDTERDFFTTTSYIH